MTPEALEKRRENLRKARAVRAENLAAKQPPAPTKPDEGKAVEFVGLTAKDCPVDCTPEHCCIAGSLVVNNPDHSQTLIGHCGHPRKSGLQPIHKTRPEIVARYHRAEKQLAQQELDRKE